MDNSRSKATQVSSRNSSRASAPAVHRYRPPLAPRIPWPAKCKISGSPSVLCRSLRQCSRSVAWSTSSRGSPPVLTPARCRVEASVRTAVSTDGSGRSCRMPLACASSLSSGSGNAPAPANSALTTTLRLSAFLTLQSGTYLSPSRNPCRPREPTCGIRSGKVGNDGQAGESIRQVTTEPVKAQPVVECLVLIHWEHFGQLRRDRHQVPDIGEVRPVSHSGGLGPSPAAQARLQTAHQRRQPQRRAKGHELSNSQLRVSVKRFVRDDGTERVRNDHIRTLTLDRLGDTLPHQCASLRPRCVRLHLPQ